MKHPKMKKVVYNTRIRVWFKEKLLAQSAENKKTGGLSSPDLIEKAVCKLMKWKAPTKKDLDKL